MDVVFLAMGKNKWDAGIKWPQNAFCSSIKLTSSVDITPLELNTIQLIFSLHFGVVNDPVYWKNVSVSSGKKSAKVIFPLVLVVPGYVTASTASSSTSKLLSMSSSTSFKKKSNFLAINNRVNSILSCFCNRPIDRTSDFVKTITAKVFV